MLVYVHKNETENSSHDHNRAQKKQKQNQKYTYSRWESITEAHKVGSQKQASAHTFTLAFVCGLWWDNFERVRNEY